MEIRSQAEDDSRSCKTHGLPGFLMQSRKAAKKRKGFGDRSNFSLIKNLIRKREHCLCEALRLRDFASDY